MQLYTIIIFLLFCSCNSSYSVLTDKNSLNTNVVSDTDETFKYMNYECCSLVKIVNTFSENYSSISLYENKLKIFQDSLRVHHLGFIKNFYVNRKNTYELKIDGISLKLDKKLVNKYRYILIQTNDRKYEISYSNSIGKGFR